MPRRSVWFPAVPDWPVTVGGTTPPIGRSAFPADSASFLLVPDGAGPADNCRLDTPADREIGVPGRCRAVPFGSRHGRAGRTPFLTSNCMKDSYEKLCDWQYNLCSEMLV